MSENASLAYVDGLDEESRLPALHLGLFRARIRLAWLLIAWCAAALWAGSAAWAQDHLKLFPRYARYERMRREIPQAVKLGVLSVSWTNGGQAFEYRKDGKRYRFDIPSRTVQELPTPTNAPGRTGRAGSEPSRARRVPPQPRPERGRQYTNAPSPDGRWMAFYRDANVWLADASGSNPIPITTNGSLAARIKYGTANWVYGEELDQDTALWWSPNSRKLAFYRFDETQVQDYYLILDQTKVQDRLDTEPYMKAGTPNPVVDIFIYDLDTKSIVPVDVRTGAPFDNHVLGHYVYGVSWTADSAELLFHRTNRRQNTMELCAADAASGRVRVLVPEQWLASWTENRPTCHWLSDGRRFIWASERTGWKNFYLYDRAGTLLATLTAHPFEVVDVVRVDEQAGLLYYTARSGDHPAKLQLHRVSLDGRGDVRLTDPAFHHTVDMAPDGRHFIDVAQTHDIPPVTCLRDANGRWIAELARSDTTRFYQLGLRPVERFSFKAGDGVTELDGLLHFPSDFNPRRRYPLLIDVYAGPGTVAVRETFTLPDPLTELGFLVARLDARSASGRGKRFLDAIYQKLGQVEVDDQAAGVRALGKRRYVDRSRVGIFGTSYGGTVSALCLLRYPELFQAACASSAVTDFRNYDTIYTERYMGLPQEAPAAYEAASVLRYVTNLQGRLLIWFGTGDNNVHPANALQLIQALQKVGKSFEVQVGPDQGHTSIPRDRMIEFFLESLMDFRPGRLERMGKRAPASGPLKPVRAPRQQE